MLRLPASPLFSLEEAIKAGEEQDLTSHLIRAPKRSEPLRESVGFHRLSPKEPRRWNVTEGIQPKSEREIRIASSL